MCIANRIGRQLAHTISGKYILEPQKTKLINHLRREDESEREWEVIIAVDGALKNWETIHLDICIRLLYFVSLFLSLSSFFSSFFIFFPAFFFLFSIGTGFTQKKHIADWSALGVGGFPQEWWFFIQREILLFFRFFFFFSNFFFWFDTCFSFLFSSFFFFLPVLVSCFFLFFFLPFLPR